MSVQLPFTKHKGIQFEKFVCVDGRWQCGVVLTAAGGSDGQLEGHRSYMWTVGQQAPATCIMYLFCICGYVQSCWINHFVNFGWVVFSFCLEQCGAWLQGLSAHSPCNSGSMQPSCIQELDIWFYLNIVIVLVQFFQNIKFQWKKISNYIWLIEVVMI